MRILYMLSENLNRISGGIVHFLAVAKNLRRLGHKVSILGPQFYGRMRRPAGFRNVLIPVPGRSIPTFLLFQLLAAMTMPAIVFLHRPEVMLVRGGAGIGFLAAAIARLLRVRVVLELNGVPWLEFENRGLPRAYSRFVKFTMKLETRFANKIIVVAPAIGEELKRVCSVCSEKLVTIHNGADGEDFARGNRHRMRRELGVSHDVLLVGYVGVFSAWHGAVVMAESAKYISPEVRRGTRYVLVGDGEQWQETKDAIRDADLAETVLLPGSAPRNKVSDYLAAFDVGIYINSNDRIAACGSPLKFWEYLAAGLPVIVSRNSSISAIVEEKQLGWVVAQVTPQALAAVVEDAYRRRRELPEWRRRIQRLAEQNFSWKSVAKRIEKVLAGDDSGGAASG